LYIVNNDKQTQSVVFSNTAIESVFTILTTLKTQFRLVVKLVYRSIQLSTPYYTPSSAGDKKKTTPQKYPLFLNTSQCNTISYASLSPPPCRGGCTRVSKQNKLNTVGTYYLGRMTQENKKMRKAPQRKLREPYKKRPALEVKIAVFQTKTRVRFRILQQHIVEYNPSNSKTTMQKKSVQMQR